MLDRMAEAAAQKLVPSDSPVETIGKINRVLFEDFDFRGATEDYYDPRNSFFNDVLDRRIGVPITLSTLYIEVARRLNIPIVGVGMPGHFIVKYSDRLDEFFLDPFNRGEILSRDDCRHRVYERYGDSVEFSDRMLGRVTHRQILWRMLNNLKEIYLKAHAFDKCLAIVDMMLMVDPEEIPQFRDRGLLRLQLRQFAGAARDLEYYIRHAPSADDREQIEGHLKELRRIRASMN
jgi:regulator of sirC expression with transglutaminase-like and TPR domain